MIKKIVALALCCYVLTFAQDTEYLIPEKFEIGGFGGPWMQGTTVNKQDALFMGGMGGCILNHSFVFGGGGWGLITKVSARVPDVSSGERYVRVGYGGVYFEYIDSPQKLFHLSGGVLVGSGGAGYKNNYNEHSSDSFFVLEPNVQAHVNVMQFFRISAGIFYRYVNGLKNNFLSDKDLSNAGVVCVFRFGKF